MVHRYITSPANPLISCTLFPPPPNPPGITEGTIGGGPIGIDDPPSIIDDEENTGGGDDDDCDSISMYSGTEVGGK